MCERGEVEKEEGNGRRNEIEKSEGKRICDMN